MMLADWPLWRGAAFRSVTGFRHDARSTAGDVVRYEQDELGNELRVSSAQASYLDRYTASQVVWITRTANSASNYGYPEAIDIGEFGRIVAEDGEGGYLVLMPYRPRMPTEQEPV